MSKKNLARTAIEGGRRGFNTWERRESNQLERVHTRSMMRAVARDPEIAESEPAPKRRPVRPEFNDKLNPVHSWIAAQHGRPWNDVRSEVHKKFDGRTTAGRHILYDHILRHVSYEWHDGPYVRTQFTYGEHDIVGLDGVLRHVRGKSYKSRWNRDRAVLPEADLWGWANGRYVRRVGSVLFWFVPTEPTVIGVSWRQGRALNEDEVELYEVLSDEERRRLITKDVNVGRWHTTLLSGAMPVPTKQKILDRVETLMRAVKFAREHANTVDAPEKSVGKPVFDYLFESAT